MLLTGLGMMGYKLHVVVIQFEQCTCTLYVLFTSSSLCVM